MVQAGKRWLRRGRAAVRLERVSARNIMPTMPHERSGPSLGKSKIHDLEIFVIFGIRGIRGSTDSEIPCQSRALPRQRHAGKEAGRESRARGRVFGTRFCRPALPHDHSGASLGKSKKSDFEISVVRFGPYLPFLALSCARSVPIGGTF